MAIPGLPTHLPGAPHPFDPLGCPSDAWHARQQQEQMYAWAAFERLEADHRAAAARVVHDRRVAQDEREHFLMLLLP